MDTATHRFRKAFDTLKWEFLDKALQSFNFGPILTSKKRNNNFTARR